MQRPAKPCTAVRFRSLPPSFLLIAALAAAPARAERIEFALYDVEGGGSCTTDRLLHAKGARDYSMKDVVVVHQGDLTSRSIPVAGGFVAGLSSFPDTDRTGFGLWLRDRESWMAKVFGPGFSWEWFAHESGYDYRKLQCGGRVRVTFSSGPRRDEIAAHPPLFSLRTC